MSGKTVLVVEDHIALANLIRELITRAGFEVLHAATGIEALDLWQQAGKQVPVVLIDLTLPGRVNGHALAEHLKAENSRTEIIMMSGDLPGDTNGSHFLQKPFRTNQLVSAIEAAFARSAG